MPGTLFKVSPVLLSYPKLINQKRVFVLEVNSSLPPIVINDNSLLKTLNRLRDIEFTKDAFRTVLQSYILHDYTADEAFDILIQHNVIIAASDKAIHSIWQQFGWEEAFTYHNYTKNYPFLDMSDSDERIKDSVLMKTFAKASPPPNIYSSFEKIDRVVLSDCSFLLKKKGLTEFEKVSLLFHLGFGERRKLDFGVQGSFLSKSIPSGGARHPLEVFFVSFYFDGLKQGIYHYNVENNALDLLSPGDYFEYFETATFDLFSKYNDKPKGLLIFTSKVERAMWQYRESRSWRATLIDTGHALMIYRKISESLGFRFYTFQKVQDKKFYSRLNLDRFKYNIHFVGTIV